MNTPLILFNKIFPQEIINNIQKYLPVNDIVKSALKKYYNELHDIKINDDEEYFNTVVYPNCVCSNCPDNGHYKIFNRKDCSPCFEYDMKEYSGYYTKPEYILVIRDNPQYHKIAFNHYNNNISNYNDHDYYDEWWYEFYERYESYIEYNDYIYHEC